MSGLRFRLVDVFAAEPLSGNSLTVVTTEQALPAPLMQRLTQELRHFETIFLTPTSERDRFRARVFTMEEELDFAGHPIVGAAAVLHEAYATGEKEARWTLALNRQSVTVESRWHDDHVAVVMRQASPEFLGNVDAAAEADFLAAFGLTAADRDATLPMAVVTTGLAYLIMPVAPSGLERARIVVDRLEPMLDRVGAKFAYVLDARNREGRTWDNLGRVEDIATGSAAGPVAGYLVKHGLADVGAEVILRQGRFVGRPSEMRLRVEEGVKGGVLLTGDVRMIASGSFEPGVGR
jgi:trans-2,3-dihydro-3-hydroxyanthranilate isomerase